MNYRKNPLKLKHGFLEDAAILVGSKRVLKKRRIQLKKFKKSEISMRLSHCYILLADRKIIILEPFLRVHPQSNILNKPLSLNEP